MIVFKRVIIALLLTGLVGAVAAQEYRGRKCVARLSPIISGVHCDPPECGGHCHRIVYTGCKDCVKGSTLCPKPPAGGCTTRQDISSACVSSASGSCECGGNWILGPTLPAFSQC